MEFLTKTDFYKKISKEILNQITGGDDSLLDDAEKVAKGIITDLLGGMYDFDVELAKTGDDRHDNLINWMLNLTVYQIYSRIPDDEVPARVIKDYDDSNSLIERIAGGKIPTSLKAIEVDGVSKRVFRMGSNTARNHKML